MQRNRRKTVSGFIQTPRKSTPISQLTLRELRDRHFRNARILSNPSGLSSANSSLLLAEQTAIESRIVEIEGIPDIQGSMRSLSLAKDASTGISEDLDLQLSPALQAKQKALSTFGPQSAMSGRSTGMLSLQEAVEIQQRAHALEIEKEALAKQRKQRNPFVGGSQLSKQERDARIWAFMNSKPTESDMEDEDEDENENEEDMDPSTWFDDDQDDGRKGQDIVEPDIEDLWDVIRIDQSKISEDLMYHYDGD